MTATIRYVRIERDCGYNKDPKTRRKLYDYHVIIDGEHRCTLSPRSYAKGYDLNSPDRKHGIAKPGERNNRCVVVKSQAEFDSTIQSALPFIPPLSHWAEVEARELKEKQEREDRQREDDRIDRIQRAAVDLLEALKELLSCSIPTGDDTKTDRAMEKARAAISKATNQNPNEH